MIDEVIVKKTANPELGYESKLQLLSDTYQHKTDVAQLMASIGTAIIEMGLAHDWSKIEYFDKFSRDTLERQDIPNFKDREWYKIHTMEERHHINARVPDDVNLFDVIEMIADCTIAGKTRTGEVDDSFLELTSDLLVNAYWNTVDLIKNKVEVE